ncbi:MAG: GlxA family transcriptional regulator [Solirubrobacteraceae bacterium]
MEPREVVLVVFEGVQSLDVTGPLEVFTGAARLAAERGESDPGYRITIASLDGGTLRSSSGLSLGADARLADLSGPIDTLLVAGGAGARPALVGRPLIDALAAAAARSRRVASVCTGAILLAEAGLLDGRRATTHWASCAWLAERYPAVVVDPDPIFVRDGSVYTSAGVTAGIDLALALVEEDLGRDAALSIARWLVMFLRRPANQAQFSVQLTGQLAERDALRELQRWMFEHPGADLSVGALAERAMLSPRHFARSFAAEIGIPPGRYVERLRVEAARRALEDTATPVAAVAAACGFGAPETMRRSFLRVLGVAPAEYRRRFQTPDAA